MADLLLVLFRDPVIGQVVRGVLAVYKWCELLSRRFTRLRADADFMIRGVLIYINHDSKCLLLIL